MLSLHVLQLTFVKTHYYHDKWKVHIKFHKKYYAISQGIPQEMPQEIAYDISCAITAEKSHEI